MLLWLNPRLLLLSDLFAGENPQWIKPYINTLESKFEIQYYDVLHLANINASGLTQMDIHNEFLNGAIDRAVENLLELEPGKVVVLGFSIGGTIGWKASFSGLKTTYLFAISSTRLRYEMKSPDCEIMLFFAETDPNSPNLQWFMGLNVA